MKQLKFLLCTFAGIFLALYILYISYFYFNQTQLVFRATKLQENHVFHFDGEFEEIKIKSFDGIQLHGIQFKSKNPKGIIFYLHGNAGNLETWGSISKKYTDLGFDFFILDYRGFGKSEGVINNENQVLNDVQTVFDSVTKKYQKKIIIGYSIGTGPASFLASVRKNDLLILKAPFENFIKYSEERAPYFPNYLKKFQFETDKYVSKINTPIYIFHGNKDLLIAIENSYRLKKLFKKTDSLFVLNNQGHTGLNENTDFQNKLKHILK